MTFVLSELIDRSAERLANHPAFRCHLQQIDYGQLVFRCNQLAHFLVDQGVERGDRVGIFLPRCLESAVAVHGILRAGAAFVPIDPSTPVTRIRQIVRDCGLRHLITTHSLKKSTQSLLAEPTEVECVVGIEVEGPVRSATWEQLDQLPVLPVRIAVHEQDLAYVMYTSGSTGRPKGIMHTHFSGLSYAELSAKTYDVRSADRIGNHSPLHFDMSTFGYFTGPLAGATTVIIPAAYTKLPASLSELMEAEELTIWYSVPHALIQLLLRGALEKRRLESLRWVLFGGEPFSPKHLFSLMSAWPQARFSNVYGPAEVNQCTYYHLPAIQPNKKETIELQRIPIGRVWDRTEGLVLVDDQPAKNGDMGELLIRSPTMMRGYWNRPDLNASAFYHRRIGPDFSDVFYRTGDVVRVEPDGSYSFHGRKDRQIKLRGHRIELDDVEAALVAHPAVEEAGAYPLFEDGETIEIAATVLIRDSKNSPDSSEIIAFATTQLPVYAVPARVNIAKTLPRTTSGKIDRRQLQRLVQNQRT